MDCPLHQQALLHPDAPFLISRAGCLRFHEADLLAARFQAVLPPAGTRLLTLVPNSPEWVCLLFACLRQQVILCPLNLRLPEARIQEQQHFLSSENLWREFPKLGNAADARRVIPEADATILFTSGSSGHPKAVPHTLANHLAAAQAANALATLGSGDRWGCALPFYHVGGLAIIFRCVLAGAALVFEEAEAVSHLSLVPTQLKRLMRGELPSGLKRILLGGAPLPASMIDEARRRGLPVASSYGMTETASQIAATPPGEAVRGAGQVMSHAEVKIDHSGEIWLRGASVSAACLHADGWLHSGDRGRLEDGILFVEGRMDRQFISGGENIQPEQIEQALMNLPGITQAVVRPRDDEEFGQRPVAWIDAAWQEDWGRELRKELPGYMMPVRFERLPEGVGLKPAWKDLKGSCGG